MYFNYFCQLLWQSSPKYKIRNTFNESNGNLKYIQESLRVNQSMNIRLRNNRHISRLGIGSVTVTGMVNKMNHETLKILAEK